jgi:hypothetical protein
VINKAADASGKTELRNKERVMMLTFFLMSQMNIQRGVCQQKYACGPHLRNHVAPKPRDGFRELREHFVIGQGLEKGDFVIKELIGSKVGGV